MNRELAAEKAKKFHKRDLRIKINSVSDLMRQIESIINEDAEKGYFDSKFSLDKYDFMKEIVHRNVIGIFVLTTKGKLVCKLLQKYDFDVKKSWFTGTLHINWRAQTFDYF